jgi:uncharacterized protein DUF4236
MGWRFWRRVRIAPGVTLNIGKSGPSSVSFGPRGLKVTAGRRGKRLTVGLPGTGLYYTEQLRNRPVADPRVLQESPASQDIDGPESEGHGPRAFWGRRSRKGKVAIATGAILTIAVLANGGSKPETDGANGGAGQPNASVASLSTPTARPTPVATATSAAEASVPPSEAPTPLPTAASPTAKPTAAPKPIPTPVIASSDDPVTFAKAKRTLTGKAGTYTWSAVTFDDQLAKLSWTASASASAGCTVSWRFMPDAFSYLDPFGGSAKAPKGGSKSGSKQLLVEQASGELKVQSSCPRWAIAGTSTPLPPYWNPWGYNFTPGRVIYDPPLEFCSYFDCIGNFGNSPGYVIQCRDDMFSTAGGRQGACSYHGGVRRPLYRH